MLAVVLICGGAGWYFKIYCPKKQQAAGATEDYGDDYDDTPPWEDVRMTRKVRARNGFTNSPYEKEKSYFKGVPPNLLPKGSRCDGTPTGTGLAACSVTGSSSSQRREGKMSRELTRQENVAICPLVKRWCANYDKDVGCLPLDC